MAEPRRETSINQPMPLYVAAIPFNDGQRQVMRAAVVLRAREDFSSVLKMVAKRPITYLGRNTRYFTVKDWREAGLQQEMYIDTDRVFDLDTKIMTSRPPLGHLSALDTVHLYEFMLKKAKAQ